ncbi:MAG TPA: XdhC family protein [Gemmatimonadaceae bacterium]|nr:XdhC family protein [Gemmatimonadaceae bacterium]
MKQWLETRQVLDALAVAHSDGVPTALATVVRVNGSAYRHEGAKLLVRADERTVGNVSGGCLEADVREVALRVIMSGVAEQRAYCGGSDEISAWDLGVGCNGEVEILIEPARAPRDADRMAMQDEVPFVVVTRLPGDTAAGECKRMVWHANGVTGTLDDAALDAHVREQAATWAERGESHLQQCEGETLFVDVMQPPPRLVIVSAGEDARVLARLASEVGFRVVTVDRRPGLLVREHFPPAVRLVESDAARLNERLVLDASCFAVVMTHDFADDTEYLRALLRTPVRYLGVLGPRQRTERILSRLSVDDSIDTSRIYGPVGLDIGTDGAEQVALAVLAEILAVKSGRRPQSLRERRAPIHAGSGTVL